MRKEDNIAKIIQKHNFMKKKKNYLKKPANDLEKLDLDFSEEGKEG